MARAKRRQLAYCVALLGVSAMVGCMNQPSIEAETPTCTPASTGSGGAYGLQNTVDGQVTFYRDLLPILRINTADKNYKCTTCHAHMAHPEGLNSVAKIEAAVDAMRKGTMPISGARVTDEEIELFDLWRLQGFQPGDPADTPAAGTPASGDATGKTGNCNG